MIRSQKIGDMITFLPGVLAIHHYFPNSKITLACRKAGLPIAGRIPFVSTVDVDELFNNSSQHLESFDLLITSSGDPEWIRLKRRLRIPFAVATLPDTLKGVCLKHRLQFHFLYDDVVRYSEDTHEVQRNLKLQDLFGAMPPMNRTLWATDEEKQRARMFIAGATSPRILISPVGSQPSKNWAPEHFAVLADLLSSTMNATLFFDGKGEMAEQQTKAIFSLMRSKPISLINKSSIGELSVLIEETDLLITVDSGPLHIAAYLNRPCIALYGPADYAQWGPWHQDMSLVKTFRAPCKCTLKDYACQQVQHCLDNIKPEDVFTAAVELLEK